MIKSLLLTIDGSNYSESVLKYGIYFAEKLESVLRVLTVVDIRLFDWSMAASADSFVPVMPSADFQAESQKMLDEKADKIIEKAADILKKSKVKYDLTKVSGIPVDEICLYAKKNDMVIIGARGEYEKWSDKLLGATVEAVTRQITKPVVLVDKTFESFDHIHCGYDGSTTANKALQLGAYLTKMFDAELKVISVFDDQEERESVLAEAEEYLIPYEINYKLRHEAGNVEEVLVNAHNNAPYKVLTLIGSYGHSRLREAIIGSTTVHVMRKAGKPILLAK